MKKMKRIFGFLLVVIMACSVVVLASCDGGDTAATTTLTLDKESVSIQTRQRTQITATTDAEKVEFSTEDETIINLSAAGKTCAISGKKAGVATVTVKAGDASVDCAVIVSTADALIFEVDSTIIETGSEDSVLNKTVRIVYDSVDPSTALTVTSEDTEIVTIGDIDQSVEYDSASGNYSTVATVHLNGIAGGMTNIKASFGTAEKICSVETATYGLEYELVNNAFYAKVKKDIELVGDVHIPAQWYWNGGLWLPVSGFLAGARTDANDQLSLPKDGAFMNQTKMTSVNIPAQVVLIGNNCFYGCTSLAKVDFDPACMLKTLGDYAFSQTKIKEAILPNNQPLTQSSGGYYYGRPIFADCSELTTVSFADDFLQWRYHTFWNCPKLDNLYIPNGAYLARYNDTPPYGRPEGDTTFYGTEKYLFGADSGKTAAPLTHLYYGGTAEEWDAYLETVETDGNNFLINYAKADIYFGATGIGTGSKPAAE